MNILKLRYKKILQKLDLSVDQLNELQNKLQAQNICAGPFIKGEKLCPNTMALSLKLNERPTDKITVRKLLNQSGITNFELIVFYLLFDLPARISNKFFNKLLENLKETVQELIEEKMVVS